MNSIMDSEFRIIKCPLSFTSCFCYTLWLNRCLLFLIVCLIVPHIKTTLAISLCSYHSCICVFTSPEVTDSGKYPSTVFVSLETLSGSLKQFIFGWKRKYSSANIVWFICLFILKIVLGNSSEDCVLLTLSGTSLVTCWVFFCRESRVAPTCAW